MKRVSVAFLEFCVSTESWIRITWCWPMWQVWVLFMHWPIDLFFWLYAFFRKNTQNNSFASPPLGLSLPLRNLGSATVICELLLLIKRLFEVVTLLQWFLGRWSVATDEQEHVTIEFFTVCTKLAEMAILYSKDLTTAKKEITSSGARPGARDYCWFRSPMPNHMS